MKTIVLQSYRRSGVPAWIERCLQTTKQWSQASGFDYELHGDEAFELCGREYLDRVGPNIRSITNLARLELIRGAHGRGYDRAIWLDADILVFDSARFVIPVIERYAVARDAWVARTRTGLIVLPGINNSAMAFMRGEPDLEMLIALTRHVALHRAITSNYQVGGDIYNGLRKSLAFATLNHAGMFSPCVVTALATNDRAVLKVQAQAFGAPVFAANLAAGEHHERVRDHDLHRAMDVLEASRGETINRFLPAATIAPPGGWPEPTTVLSPLSAVLDRIRRWQIALQREGRAT